MQMQQEIRTKNMLKTWTSKYPPILKLACPQAINQIKLMSHVRGNIKNSQQVEITIFIYPSSTHCNPSTSLINTSHCSCQFPKPHKCVCIYVEHSHSKGKEITQVHQHANAQRKFPKCAMPSKSIQYKSQNQEVFIRLIMGLGGHDNWVRDEYLANVGLNPGT